MLTQRPLGDGVYLQVTVKTPYTRIRRLVAYDKEKAVCAESSRALGSALSTKTFSNRAFFRCSRDESKGWGDFYLREPLPHLVLSPPPVRSSGF